MSIGSLNGMWIHVLTTVLLASHITVTNALLKRCYQCRSRSELGSCKDPFLFNATEVENERGLTAVPCASGWCGKVIEGMGSFREDDYDTATQRMCVQRGPSDSEDRCAYTVYNHKKVYMCFCQGDLCNNANDLHRVSRSVFTSIAGGSLALLSVVYAVA
ncbi:protein quiver-like [Anopheles albimanus]|uniref:protein quiver-like n=1 Tax=Anopheles albimanus TaxID=7167 RepID=UPI0016412935|nr:protein quiver-like [Anopheles albimanus]